LVCGLPPPLVPVDPAPVPPPHDARSRSRVSGASRRYRAADPLGLRIVGSRTMPSIVRDHIQMAGLKPDGCSDPMVRAVVATLIFTVVGVLALNCWLVGPVQVAPFGAPAQVKAAVPLDPTPPIDRM
jgi:hypothetical protein